MADWKKNRQKFQMPHDRVERCMRYVKAVEKDERRAEKARKARFEALLLERWQARQANRENGDAEIQRIGDQTVFSAYRSAAGADRQGAR